MDHNLPGLTMGETWFPWCPGPGTLSIYLCIYIIYIYKYINISISAGPSLEGATRLRRVCPVKSSTVTFLSLKSSNSEMKNPWIRQLLVDSRAQNRQIHPPLEPSPGSLHPSRTMLPPGRECNPAHSGVPGPQGGEHIHLLGPSAIAHVAGRI